MTQEQRYSPLSIALIGPAGHGKSMLARRLREISCDRDEVLDDPDDFSAADAVVLVIDAEQGISAEVRRQVLRLAQRLAKLGDQDFVLAVNKVDLIHHDQAQFMAVVAEARVLFGELGLQPVAIVPLTAHHGVNLADALGDEAHPQISWWRGPTLVGALDTLRRWRSATVSPLRPPLREIFGGVVARATLSRMAG